MRRYNPLVLLAVSQLPFAIAACGSEDREPELRMVIARLTANAAITEVQPAITEVQPAIAYAGRAVAGSVSPTNANIAYVAAETGGVFKTSDAGATWMQLATLPQYRISDVKINPRATNQLIVTTHDDEHVTNQAGIWRSTNAGASFSRVNLVVPCSAPPLHGQGIAFAPDRDDVFVGIVCNDLNSGGVAVSHDRGVTWTFVNTGQGVHAVVAQANRIVDIYGSSGHQRSTNGGASFGALHTGVPGNGAAHHVNSLAISALNPNVLFAATPNAEGDTTRLFESDDGGVTWRQLPETPAKMRPPSVATRNVGGQLRLYFSDGKEAWRRTCTGNAPVGSCSAADLDQSWEMLDIDHADPAGFVFGSTGNCPRFILGDSGILTPSDLATCSGWRTIPGGPSGYNALQIYEVAAQVHPDHSDLYFGTQDNFIWASPDGGQTWSHNMCCEGKLFQLVHATPNDTDPDNFITFNLAGGDNMIVTPHMQTRTTWKDAPGVPPEASVAPFLIAPSVYVQWSRPTDQSASLYITADRGANWSPVNGAVLEGIPTPSMRIAGPPASPVIYQPYSRPDGSLGLVKITNVRTDLATVTPIDQRLGQLGRSCGDPAAYYCPEGLVGVDPNDADHLIAGDVASNLMKVSRDGGANWTADAALTAAVTADGFMFSNPDTGTEVRSISFNPANGEQILVGTMSNGVIASSDGGVSWFKIDGSTAIKNVSSFAWDEVRDQVFVSSYGRGLYKIASTVSTGPLRLQYRVGDSSPTDQSINPRFKLFNETGAAVALRELKIRYWYTIDGERAQQFWVDYAQQLPSGSVTGSFVKLTTPRPGADFYAEVGFTSAAGSLATGDSQELHVRFNKVDWTNYNEIGDYSYVAGQYVFADAPRTTVYRNGQLVWGTEP